MMTAAEIALANLTKSIPIAVLAEIETAAQTIIDTKDEYLRILTGHLPASINEWFGVGWHSAKSQTAHFRQHKQPELVMRLTKGEIRPQPTDQKAR